MPYPPAVARLTADCLTVRSAVPAGVGLAILERQLKPKDLVQLWDKKGKGGVSKVEFRQGLIHSLGISAEMRAADILFDQLDDDGGGTLDLGELDLALRKVLDEAATREESETHASAHHGASCPQVRDKAAKLRASETHLGAVEAAWMAQLTKLETIASATKSAVRALEVAAALGVTAASMEDAVAAFTVAAFTQGPSEGKKEREGAAKVGATMRPMSERALWRDAASPAEAAATAAAALTLALQLQQSLAEEEAERARSSILAREEAERRRRELEVLEAFDRTPVLPSLELRGRLDALDMEVHELSHAPPIAPSSNADTKVGQALAQKNLMTPKEVAKAWDSKGRGEVGRLDFRLGIKALGVKLDEKEVDRLFGSLDADGTGALDVAELHEALRVLREAAMEAEEAPKRRHARQMRLAQHRIVLAQVLKVTADDL